MTGYEALVELSVREAELIAAGQWEEAVEVGRVRADIVATLPDTPPADAADALARAAQTVRSTTGAASVAVAETREQLRRLQDGRRALQGYTRTS